MKLSILLVIGSCLAASCAQAAGPVFKVVRASNAGTALLRNGGFERVTGNQPADWNPAPQGFRLAPGEGRGGSQALACDNPSGDGWFGASQTLILNRTNVAPITIRGWSRARSVTGGADSGYSLYADLVYADGTPLWGQTGNFHCGTHDWQQREFVILPAKPVKSLTLHCLFRGHGGTVWFDDVAVEEITAEGGAVVFQGVPVVTTGASPRPDPQSRPNLVSPAAHGVWLARDVAAKSDYFAFQDGACPELNLRLQARFVASANHTAIEGRVIDTTGRDRAVSLVFALPLEVAGWQWGDDIRRSRRIEGRGEFLNPVGVRSGATGTMSLYPVGAIWRQRDGLALALDMAKPAQYRIGCHAGLKVLFMAYDFGLARETAAFPGAAEFRFVLFSFPPREGFRSAWQRYTEIFPDHFVVRSKEQGLWMPFTDVSTVQGWEDFGFRYHEGNNNVPWDDAHGILSFRYTEPMTWWMRMQKDAPRTLAEAIRIRDDLATGASGQGARMAQVSKTAAMFDEAAQPSVIFRDTPWCDGAVWSLNPNPFLSGPRTNAADPRGASAGPSLLNAATVHWNDRLKEALYGPGAKGRLDGEYLDSLEGYVTAELNFRREHFLPTTVPLTFSTDTKKPALFKGLAVFEFTQWISDEVHGLGKLMFANGVPYRFTFLCPWLDVLGTETDWLRGGRYQPAALTTMDLWRTMSGQKPYLLLMNTDYDKFTPELVEKYFQRCLFYGMWPGFFSHNASENPYWKNPKWYNRDRPLFRKYLPLVRHLTDAGWQVVTEARCDNDRIGVERFGPDTRGRVFLTLHNDTPETQEGRMNVNLDAVGVPARCAAQELLSGETFSWPTHGWRLSLRPQETKVVQLAP